MSSQRLQVGDDMTLLATTAASPRLPRRGVALEVRDAVAGIRALERSKPMPLAPASPRGV